MMVEWQKQRGKRERRVVRVVDEALLESPQ